MNLLSILGGNAFVMFNKELAHKVSVNGAIIFGQLCSSYESFGSKNILTIREGKEFFFLTSEVIEVETALTYKQQLKAIKDLEEAGYIDTVIMGTPAKKYFHITNKIFQQFSFDKKEELNELNKQENLEIEPTDAIISYDKLSNRAMQKSQSKPLPIGQAFKEINEKEKIKENNDNKNPNPKPNPIDSYEVLWNTELPMNLKTKIKVMIVNKQISLTAEEILLIEDAYKYQISKGYIVPDCSMDDIQALNDFEFSNTVSKMLRTVKDIRNIRGMIKEWVEIAYSYKQQEFHVTDYSGKTSNLPYYDWLKA